MQAYRKLTLFVLSTSQPTANNGMFTAPLMAGGNTDTSLFLAGIGTMTNASYQ